MKTTVRRIYERIVMPGGLISVAGIFYQVPAELTDQRIAVDVDQQQFFRLPLSRGGQSVAPFGPLLPTLQPGTWAS